MLTLRLVAGPSFEEHVADIARELRDELEVDLLEIAYWSGVAQSTISRWERHKSHVRELDALVRAYAKVSTDWGRPLTAGDLLREAITRWEEAGGDELPKVRPLRQAARAAKRLAATDQPAPDTAREGPAARGRRRAS